jgi:hypothetical protein
MRAVVNCRVCELETALQLFVVTICKCLVNPITNSNPSRVTHLTSCGELCFVCRMLKTRFGFAYSVTCCC